MSIRKLPDVSLRFLPHNEVYVHLQAAQLDFVTVTDDLRVARFDAVSVQVRAVLAAQVVQPQAVLAQFKGGVAAGDAHLVGMETAQINDVVMGTIGPTDNQLLAERKSQREGNRILVKGEAGNFRDIRVAPRGFGIWGAGIIDASGDRHSGNPDHQ
jgi:hypothetical protein